MLFFLLRIVLSLLLGCPQRAIVHHRPPCHPTNPVRLPLLLSPLHIGGRPDKYLLPFCYDLCFNTIHYVLFWSIFFKQKMSDWVKRIKSLFKCPPPPFFSFSSWLRCEHLSRSLAVFSLLSSEASHLQWKRLRRVEKRSPRFNLISVNLFISLATFNNGQQLIGL